jgi:hypothetical protein
MRQSLKPDKIILWLSEKEIKSCSIPSSLKRLQKRGLEVRFVKENLRSYKKIIYSLREYPDANIVTIDDDVYYPRYFLEKIYNKKKHYSGCIVGYRCKYINKKNEYEVGPYLSWPHVKKSEVASLGIFPTGNGGILYPPNSLNNEVFNKNIFLKLCPYGDDIWLKAMSLLQRTKVVQVFDEPKDFITIKDTQKEALHLINNSGPKLNDKQIKKVFDFYNLYKYLE